MNYKANYKKGIFLFSNNGFSAFRISDFLLTVILLFSFLLFCSKDSTNGTDTITISGTVTLEGQTDHSGVTARLYRPVQLDTALVRINQQYPNIGVQISQETEFDHRECTPVYSTTTNAAGNWSMANVTPGTYNVVAEKDSFGWKYIINKDTGTEFATINLDKVVKLSGTLTQSLILNNKFIQIEDLTIPNNVVLEIKGESYVLLNENAGVDVFGNFLVEGTTKNKVKLFSRQNKTWNRIKVNFDASLNITNAIISGANTSIYNRSKNFQVQNVQFISNINAIENFDINDTLTIKNCTFRMNNMGLENEAVLYSKVKKNIFYKNEVSLGISASQVYSEEYDADIEQNIFHTNTNAIFINYPVAYDYAPNYGNIDKNIFKNIVKAIIMGKNASYDGNENNFFKINNKFLEVIGLSFVSDTLNFQQNYWGLFNEHDIKAKIIDVEDDPVNFSSYVEVNNFLLKPAIIDQ